MINLHHCNLKANTLPDYSLVLYPLHWESQHSYPAKLRLSSSASGAFKDSNHLCIVQAQPLLNPGPAHPACTPLSMPLHKAQCTASYTMCLRPHANHHYAGYLFSQQGIMSCEVDTSAAVGSTFSIIFVVFDSSIPSLNASVTRTGIIINPCATGQYLCPDRTCSPVACDIRQAHHATAAGTALV